MEAAEGIVLTAHGSGLYLTTFGKSQTYPGHAYGPAVRPYYLIHFILSGKGVFQIYNDNKQVYHLHQGQGFLIAPEFVTRYESDSEEPWGYVWIAFGGADAQRLVSGLGLNQDSPIFSFTQEQQQQIEGYVEQMLDNHDAMLVSTLRRMSLFYNIMALLGEAQKTALPPSSTGDYVTSGLEFVRNHIEEPFTVQDLADYLRLNRSYMTTLFKEKIGMSPHEYIEQCRINKSGHLLESSSLSIEAIAYSCGYAKADSYTRAFQRQKGMSPAAYRRICRQEQYTKYLNDHK